jgi:hypothetical protein
MMQGTEGRVATGASPLAATLDRVSSSEVGESFSSRLGVPEEPGWTPATDLALDDELLGELLRRTGRGYATGDRMVEGSFFLKSYLWRVLGSAVAAFLLDRRVPDLGAQNLALRFDERGYAAGVAYAGGRFAALPTDRDAANHPDAHLLSEHEILGWLRDGLTATHLPGLYAALRRSRARRGTRALWGAAVDAVAETFVFAGRGLGCEAEASACARRLLSGPPPLCGPTNYYVLEHEGGREATRVRNTCCLYHRVAEKACFTCPRVTDEERRQRLAAG